MIAEAADEFERFFTFTDGPIALDENRETFERAFVRLESLFNVLLVSEESVAAKLTLLRKKGGADDVIELLKRVTPNVARLFKMLSRVNQCLCKPEYADRFVVIRERLVKFQKEHRLHAFDPKPFKSRLDPVSRTFDYE